MKRWQDCGEVADSDEEDIDIQVGSPTKRPQKRAKLTDQDDVTTTGGRSTAPIKVTSSTGSEGESKAATTCGRRGKILRPTARVVSQPQSPSKPRDFAGSPSNSTKPQQQAADREQNAVNPGTSSEQISHETKLLEHESQTSPAFSSLLLLERQGSVASDSDDLPDVADLFATRSNVATAVSTPLSSPPLSELEVSPAQDLTRLDSLVNGEQSCTKPDSNVELDIEDDFGVAMPFASIAKRNLRRRKEIQLHPYLIEKAKYQRQCKERGVRPVRLVQAESQPEDTESALGSGSQAEAVEAYSSSPMVEDLLRKRKDTSRNLATYDFDAASSSSDKTSTEQRLPKRRKLGHSRNIFRGLQTLSPESQFPVFDLSKPPSSSRELSPSGSSRVIYRRARQTASGFRVLDAFSPVPLPTPEVSSDVRDRHAEHSSDSEAPRRAAGRSNHRQEEHQRVASRSARPSSEVESEAEAEAHRLRREQKRVRGVLPASWLKIDLRKQRERRSASPEAQHRPNGPSADLSGPQKGVARTVRSGGRRGSDRGDIVAFSDDDAESDDSVQLLPLTKNHLRLVYGSDDTRPTQLEPLHDDVMENDFVDAMLAGPSSRKRADRKSSRQPRITQSFRKWSSPKQNYSEERTARKNALGTQRRSTGSKAANKQQLHRLPPVRLSIVDAPVSPAAASGRLPQFIKIAQRQARHLPNQGRHSPMSKVIRLATLQDTDDALSVLKAWWAGAIVARDTGGVRARSPASDASVEERVPFAELSNNPVQRTWPSPVRKTQAKRANRIATTVAFRKPRLRQTRLQPVSINNPRDKTLAQMHQVSHYSTQHRKHTAGPRQRPTVRSAQLESLQEDFDRDHRSTLFERRMQCLTENIAITGRRGLSAEAPLARFLNEDFVSQEGSSRLLTYSNKDMTLDNGTRREVPIATLAHRPRKAQPHRIDVNARKYRQPSEPLADLMELVEETSSVPDMVDAVLLGLGAFGTQYSVGFDVQLPEVDTFFKESTFIGSGELHDALRLQARDLDRQYGCMRVTLQDGVAEWGGWNEDVVDGFRRVPETISMLLRTAESTASDLEQDQQRQSAAQQVDQLLRSVIRYCAKFLHFLDPIDRSTATYSLLRLCSDLDELFAELQGESGPAEEAVLHTLQYNVVIAHQAVHIAHHSSVNQELKQQASEKLRITATTLFRHAVCGRLNDLRRFYEDNKRLSIREAGTGERAWALSSMLILSHTFPGPDFWLIIKEFGVDIEKLTAVKDLETLWRDLFTILPTLMFDDRGVAQHRLQRPLQENAWTIPRSLICRTLQLYEKTSRIRGYTVNDYVRSLLKRCHRLIEYWGQWKCESVFFTIYDFFAKRKLALLKNEESKGSPPFLETFASNGYLELLPDDCSFHIFLKILATGLVGMRTHQVYPERKIGNLQWRLIPSHGRTYNRKDVDLSQGDLNALRNHHDLFCTLYCALPSKYRIKVTLLRELVDHSTAHREACRLNVRSWTKVAAFQASTSESLDGLTAFSDWYSAMLRATIVQYRLARSEAEHDFALARLERADISSAILEGTIANNQRATAATLVDLLAGLKRVLSSASDLVTVQALVEKDDFCAVLELFDPAERRLLSAAMEALQVMDTALEMEQVHALSLNSQQTNDESQDFGDSSALQEFAELEQPVLVPSRTSAVMLVAPAGHFLSKVFGADSVPDDMLLQKAIDIWIRIATCTVKSSNRSWLSYVDSYSPASWSLMRDTPQRRKFTAYFMSRVIEKCGDEPDVRQTIMGIWLMSLVEREALLKYQHIFTVALVTHCESERTLQNLPVAKNLRTGHFDLSLDELRQRRLSFANSVLSNMREEVFETSCHQPWMVQEVKSKHAGILRSMMQAMKTNYQDLQTNHTAGVAEANIQGSYVEFVQHVVSILQQHTADICKVDPFFLDSSAFPLPAKDPTYVVGKLKSYAPKLRDTKGRKELAVFIQAVGERAAVDGQQRYLVDQIYAATQGEIEGGDSTAPSLRHVLVTAIFPAYLRHSVQTSCGWILALPMLQACELIFQDLFYLVRIDEEESALAAAETVVALLHGIQEQCSAVQTKVDILQQAYVLRILTIFFGMCKSALPLASYMQRPSSPGELLRTHLQGLVLYAKEMQRRLRGHVDRYSYDAAVLGSRPASPWPDTEVFAERQARDSLANWSSGDGQYHFRRGNSFKEVEVALDDLVEERTRLLQAIERFQDGYEATFDFRCRQRRAVREDVCGLGDLLV